MSERATTLVDANVLLDVAKEDPVWAQWSAVALAEAAERGGLAINPLIYAEVSVEFDRRELLDAVLPADEYARLDLPWDAAFLAGKAFLAYRRAGGTAARRSRTSTSARTPRSPACLSSPATRGATAPTSRSSS